jgi:hypothetical protein
MRPAVFWKVFILCRSRRCRIKFLAQNRFALPVLGALLVLGFGLSGCRQDMQNQPKFIPLRSNTFFPDQRSSRDPVPGTVARDQLDEDTYFFTGKHGNVLGNELPDEFSKENLHSLLLHGQERYTIYCTPCHARVGDGRGMIVQRGFKQPPSFHEQRLRNAPLGHFFDVMTNGFGAMPDYAAQIQPKDRWAIAAYIRALQRSQNAKPDDFLPQERNTSNRSSTDSKAPEAERGAKP